MLSNKLDRSCTKSSIGKFKLRGTYSPLICFVKPGRFKYNGYEFNFEPFYVGKGKNQRIKSHLRTYNKTYERNKEKSNIIKDILDNNSKPILIKLIEGLSESEAYKKESEIIKLIGRQDLNLGPLTNKNDGGFGSLGTTYPEEAKEKLRQMRTGDKNPMYGKTKELNPFYKKNHSLETREKLSRNRKGKEIGSKNNNWKHEYKITNLETNEIFYTTNLKQFSKEHNINLSSLKWAFQTGKNHKNIWKVEKTN